jgi:malignant T-cell-amplified sequence
VKSSAQRSIRSAILSNWKVEPETLESFWPKKETLTHVKWSVSIRWSDMQLNLSAVGSSCRFTPLTASRFSSSNQMVHFTLLCVYYINVRHAISFAPFVRLIRSLDPYILPALKVDRGAIRFLLAGANMMCPGLTSAGGYLPPDDTPLEAGTPVAIFAEGKEHAAGIGITKLSTIEMRQVNKGIGVETITYLGDDLWGIHKF